MNSAVALQIFNSMAPVFILIFLGWMAVHKKLVDKSAKKLCSTLVTDFVFPALLFHQTYKSDPATVFNGKWMLAFTIAMCSMWIVGYLVNMVFLKKDIRASAMQAMLSSFPNMGGMGIPFLWLLLGASSAISVAVAHVLVAITIIPATLFIMDLGSAKNNAEHSNVYKIIGSSIVNSLKKPMVAAVIIGMGFSLTGASSYLPKFVTSSLDIVASSCNFISLFAVGVAIYGTRLTVNKDLGLNLFVKCILNPALVWCLVLFFSLTGQSAEEMIFLLAMPTSTTAAILAYQWQVQEKEASSIYMASTALSIIILPALLILMQMKIPGVH